MRHNESGKTALIAILFLSSALIAGALVVLSMAAHRYRAAIAKVETWQAHLWAESGISDAANRLMHDPFYRADGSDTYPLLVEEFQPNGRYEVKIESFMPPDRFRIISTGSHKSIMATASQEVLIRNPILFALVSQEEVDISDAKVWGSVLAAGDVRLRGSSEVSGSIQTTRNFVGPIERVGSIFQQANIHPFSLDSYNPNAFYPSYAHFPGGSLSNVMISDSVVRISGASDVSGLNIENGTLIVDGPLRVKGNLQIQSPPGEIALFVHGDFTVEESGRVLIKGPVLVTGRFQNLGPARFQGSLIARRIDARSGFEASADPLLAYIAVKGLPFGIEMGRYREGKPE